MDGLRHRELLPEHGLRLMVHRLHLQAGAAHRDSALVRGLQRAVSAACRLEDHEGPVRGLQAAQEPLHLGPAGRLLGLEGHRPGAERGPPHCVEEPPEAARLLLLLLRRGRGQQVQGPGAPHAAAAVRGRARGLERAQVGLQSRRDLGQMVVVVPAHRHADDALPRLLLHGHLDLLLHALLAAQARQAAARHREVGHGRAFRLEEVLEPALLHAVEQGTREGANVSDGKPQALHPDKLHLPAAPPVDDGAELLRGLGRQDANEEDVSAHREAQGHPDQQQHGRPEQQRELEAEVADRPGAGHVAGQEVRGQRVLLALARARGGVALVLPLAAALQEPRARAALHTVGQAGVVHDGAHVEVKIPHEDHQRAGQDQHANGSEDVIAHAAALAFTLREVAWHTLLAALDVLTRLARGAGPAALDLAAPAATVLEVRDGGLWHRALQAALVPVDAAEVAELLLHLRGVRALLGARLRPREEVLLTDRHVVAAVGAPARNVEVLAARDVRVELRLRGQVVKVQDAVAPPASGALRRRGNRAAGSARRERALELRACSVHLAVHRAAHARVRRHRAAHVDGAVVEMGEVLGGGAAQRILMGPALPRGAVADDERAPGRDGQAPAGVARRPGQACLRARSLGGREQ
mmetsp:Transcript_9320/g.26201  ORF Transcript_9320/g.26201 Transcript_9320/m.26201 type:complete len:639 (+) Transcript_9320:1305-3221(+)